MDESVINGANLFFPGQFGIDPGFMAGANKNQWLLGLVNSAPYVRSTRFPVNLWLTGSSIALLWRAELLVDRTSEPLPWPSRHNLRDHDLVVPGLHLADGDEFLGTPLRCTLRARARYRPELGYRPCFRCGVCTVSHPGKPRRHVVRSNISCSSSPF